ncbi:MAG TPA: class I SAM-dependent RNA methyltransferase [Thermomicrobiales bacterium]|nr:class I SAM-dependent RNA methyltransferase [Thermomicrobiales bacterium]
MTGREGTPQFIDVTIDRIVGNGKGIGFADGKTVFVSRTAPGDVVRARITRQQRTTLHGAIDEIITPSPMRTEPDIPDPHNAVGCDLMHISYEDQLATKVGIIQDSLRRIAKLDEMPAIEVRPSEQQWGYRSRAEWQVNVPNKLVGLFAEGTRRIVDIDHDPVATEGVNTLLTTLRDDVDAGLVPEAAKEYRAVATGTGFALESTATTRSAMLMQEVSGETFQFSAECFFQANVPVAADLLQGVLAIAKDARQERGIAIDLYCGVGLFTVPLSRLFNRAIGVESFKPAAGFAEHNLETAGLTKTKIVAAPVEQWVGQDQSNYGRIALLVFDPPRTGAGAKTIEGILRLKPAHIAAVSCDPATFARDLRGLLDGGYELVDITAYDMFPQTHHVEILAHLRRRDV